MTDMHRLTYKDAFADDWAKLSDDDKQNFATAEVWQKGEKVELASPEDTGVYRFFNPMMTKEELTVTREKEPAEPAGGGQ